MAAAESGTGLMRLFFPSAIVLVLATPALAATADSVPSFDIARNCGFEARGGINPQQTLKQCKQDEDGAKKQLRKEWSTFKERPKHDCLEESTIGGERSYVELQTCLEMSSETGSQMVGQAPSNPRQKSRKQ